MILKSIYKPVPMTAEQAFLFYSLPANLEALMPEQIVEWECDGSSFRFLIKGMGHVRLVLGENVQYSKVVYRPEGKMPFAFELQFLIEEKDFMCQVQVAIDADLSNPLMAMLAQNPLQNLVNEMAVRL